MVGLRECRIVALVTLVLVFGPYLGAQTPSRAVYAPLEITRVDLFGMKGWTSRKVSVSGFMLGMSRKQAFQVLQHQPLRLDDDLGQGCLKEETCNALNVGQYIGLRLFFGGDNDTVEKITIETPSSDVPRADQSNWLVNRFLGQTLQFFDIRSDKLQSDPWVRLFGSPDSFWAGTYKPPKKSLFDPPKSSGLPARGYEYRRLGLVVRLKYGKSLPYPRVLPAPVNVAVDFVPPQVK